MWSSQHKAFATTWSTAIILAHLLCLFAQWHSSNYHISIHLLFFVVEIWFSEKVLVRSFTSTFRHLPSAPDEHFIFGHTLSIVGEGRAYRFLDWMRRVPNDGLLRLSSAGYGRNGLLVTRPEVAHEVLVTNANKFEKPKPLRKWLNKVLGGIGLIAIEGKAHAVQRRGLARAFTNTSMRALTPLLWSKSQDLTKEILKQVENQPNEPAQLDMSPISAGATLDIISIALFGKDMACLEHADEPLQRDWGFITNPAQSDGKLTRYFILNLALPDMIADWFAGSFGNQFHSARKRLRDLCKDLITERRHDPDQEHKVDILSLMIRDERAFMNDAELIDQLLTFLAAGHDTTSGAFLWSLWLLSEHTDIQSRIRDEIKAVLADEAADGKEFDADTLDKLVYTTAAATEVLRLNPTVPITPRTATQSLYLNNVPVPKGTRVYLSAWALQRMQDVWGEDAECFRPDRWLEDPEAGGATTKHAFLTFIEGPRACIGQHLARNELRCLLAAVLCKLEFTRLESGQEMTMTGIITSQPVDGMKLAVRRI